MKKHNAKVLASLRAQQVKRDVTKKIELETLAEKEPGVAATAAAAAAETTSGAREKEEEENNGEEEKATYVCTTYNAEATMACSRCKTVYYCGVECQRSNWGAHRSNCKEK